MAERLTTLMKVTQAHYTPNSPLLLEAYALYRDTVTGQCIAQLKWKNIDPKPVKAVMIELRGTDVFNQKIDTVSFQYYGILVKRGEEFGSKTAVNIQDSRADRFEVVLNVVSFSDGSVWKAETTEPMAALPDTQKQTISGEMLMQLRRDLSEHGITGAAALYTPQTAMGLWQCGCGSWQGEGEECIKCHMSMEQLKELSNPMQLADNLKAYEDKLERLRLEAERKAEEERIRQERREEERRIRAEEERIARERRIRAEEERIARERRKKRTIIITVLLSLLIITGLIFGYREFTKYPRIGSVYTFGSYEQDNDTSNGAEPIEWIVLDVDKENGTALLISKYGLDAKPFNTSETSITWEKCTLRTWLNNDFYNAAFTAEEKEKILLSNVSADKNPDYSTSQGNDTQDKVYLLSIVEAEKYFSSNSDRVCSPTKYAVANGAYKSVDDACWWWLRSSGDGSDFAALVGYGSDIFTIGDFVDSVSACVRPVVRVGLF